jgi:hypothetical protein
LVRFQEIAALYEIQDASAHVFHEDVEDFGEADEIAAVRAARLLLTRQ